jgi:hypothetical protein
MATTEQQIRTTDVVDDPVEEKEYHRNVAVRAVWFIAGILNALLAIRFVLALLGANPGNAFVSLIYSITYPLVAPFFSVFGYNFTLGQARFEGYTLLAMIIYTLIAYAVSRLLTLTSRRAEPTV